MKRIGILGGTFDPPHFGHLLMAELVYEEMGLDEIWFLPSHIPPHKQKATVSSRDRLAMVEQAIKGNSHFHLCGIEMTREGPSYTVDTMTELKNEFPGDQFYFIIGGDMVEHLPKWNRIEELTEIVEFIGVKRPGYTWSPTIPVHQVEVPLVGISSSIIRRRTAMKQSVRYMVPDSVDHYIKEHRLYELDS